MATHPTPTDGRGSVLVVDDEPAVRAALAYTLRGSGHGVTEASGVDQALQALASATFDVIVSDIHMPGLDGLELLRTVRGFDLDVPVVLVTGAPDIKSATVAVGHGAFSYLIKPVEPAELRRVVSRAVDLYRIARLKREALTLLAEGGQGVNERSALEAAFESALASLWIAYQPLIAVGTRQIYGYEALVRSKEPALPNPLALFDAAARLGRSRQLARRIREAAASPCLNGTMTGTLFVNVNPNDLLDEAFYQSDSALGSIARSVVLEITERASLESVPDLRERVARLRTMGFRIAVDDLGSGYAGLSSFALLEPEVVKLDMTLVRGVCGSETKQRLIRSMATLCKEMGLLVVAEGVETLAERDAVVALGCDIVQGYLFARPGPAFPTWTWGTP